MEYIAEMREKALHDEATAMNAAEKRGEKRGRDEGIVLGAIGIMRDDGVAEEKIMQRIMKKYQVSEDDAKRLMDEEKELV